MGRRINEFYCVKIDSCAIEVLVFLGRISYCLEIHNFLQEVSQPFEKDFQGLGGGGATMEGKRWEGHVPSTDFRTTFSLYTHVQAFSEHGSIYL